MTERPCAGNTSTRGCTPLRVPTQGVPGRIRNGAPDLAVLVRGSGKHGAPFARFVYRVSGAACRAGGPGMGAAHGAATRYRAAAMDSAAGALQRAAIDGARVVERELLEASEDFAAVQRKAGNHAFDIVFMYVERA